jgi:tRNA U34 2-thiouridine synthase MnmA/TrmU
LLVSLSISSITPYFHSGELTKVQVREIAHQINLPNADRKDSQGLCFIGKIPMSEFLKKKLPEQQGDIIDQTGKKVGTHQGARFYTLGQRHQLFLPFKAYVTATDVSKNTR